MPRTPIWKSIEAILTKQIAGGEYAPGDRLPTEAALAARFGVNRHTVRRAMAQMAESGLVHARRGTGVFVATAPTDYPIGARVRFHQNVLAAGRTPAKEILSLETRGVGEKEQASLQLKSGAQVHVLEGLSLADGAPLAVFRSVFPAEPFPDLPAHLHETRAITEALVMSGVADYTRAWTRLTAKLAGPMQALHLRVPQGSPILRSVSVNADLTGMPIELGHTWFAGDRVTLTLGGD